MKMRARVGKMPKTGPKHQDLIDLLLEGNGLYDMQKRRRHFKATLVSVK